MRANQFTLLGQRLFISLLGRHRTFKILARTGVLRSELQGLPKMNDRLIALSAGGQRRAKVVVGFRVIGFDFDGLLVLGGGLVELSPIRQARPRWLWVSARLGLSFRAFW